jgi:hypothetical protein
MPRKSGIYPASIQADSKFCETLEQRKDAESLLDPFVVVRHKEGGRSDGNPATDDLVAVPDHVAYGEDMKAISAELTAAAAVLAGDASERLQVVPRGSRKAFLDDGWFAADIAWKAMISNSVFLRVAPDEVLNLLARPASTDFAKINNPLSGGKETEPVRWTWKGVAALAGHP